MSKLTLKIILLLTVMVVSSPRDNLRAQQASPTAEQIAERRRMMEEQRRTDWAQTKKYAAENETLVASGSNIKRTVYIGDSITEFWWKYDSAFWKDNGYVDRGISAQTSSQMLVRFRRDVVDIKAEVVVINAGTNDIAENTGPISLEHIFGNIISMVDIANANRITVVLTSVLPASVFPWKKEIQPTEKIIRLNGMIKSYAASHNIIYVDYWKALVDSSGGLDVRYSGDGVHPNLIGYRVMEPLAMTAILASQKKQKPGNERR